MIWLRGMLVGALALAMSPIGAAQGVAGQKLGPCGETAALKPGEIVSAIVLSMLGQNYISSQSNDETLLMTQCASKISYYICANDPINDRIGGPALLDSAKKGGIIGGLYGLVRPDRTMVDSAVTGAAIGGTFSGFSEIMSIAQCGRDRDALLSIAQRARLDWRIYTKPGRLQNSQLAARDFDNQLHAAMQAGAISRADYGAINAMFTKWSGWLVP